MGYVKSAHRIIIGHTVGKRLLYRLSADANKHSNGPERKNNIVCGLFHLDRNSDRWMSVVTRVMNLQII